MKRVIYSVVLVTALLITGSAQAKTVKVALTQRLPKVDLTGVSLVDAFDFLRDVSGLNIHVNWTVLEAAGINKDAQVNMRLRQVSVRTMLNLLCSETGASNKITWYLDDNIIEITSREEADKVMITRVYPVEDLLLEIPNFTNAPDFNLNTNGTANNSNSGGGGMGLNIGGNNSGSGTKDEGEEAGKTRAERANDLVKLIMEIVRPEIWRDNGGPASIRFFNGSLIVTAPRSVHELIGGR